MSQHFTRLRAAVIGAAALAVAAPVSATDVKFMMDWAWQSPQAFALIARDSGCFADKGVTITLDRGFGSGRVPVELAAGSYQMGYADINPTIKFLAENPEQDIVAVAILVTRSPVVAIVHADSGIETPKDLEGRTLASPTFDTGRQLFPVFAEATGVDAAKVNWATVDPQLREAMLVQRQVDGITGFTTSSIPSIVAAGVPADKLRLFRFADHGVELYSSSILTTRRFATENPDAVRAVVGCMIEGLRQAIADPNLAVEALARHEALTDKAVELGRWQFMIDDLMLIDDVRENGLSHVDMDRLQQAITPAERAYGLQPRLRAEDLFMPDFLPPLEARKLL